MTVTKQSSQLTTGAYYEERDRQMLLEELRKTSNVDLKRLNWLRKVGETYARYDRERAQQQG